MKIDAIWFLGPRCVGVRQVEVGAPGPFEVQVEVKACGICMGDIFTFSGKEERSYPFIAGHEGVGVITEVGSEVRGFACGDKVALSEGG
ncbi:MAG: alcohol dehydrogenase catalytic domain-containing protein [Firmicutes bacterium]|nr:alcohol dehydrogenase catalytic domain-containing protein [Bacillota bacterium]